MNDYLPIGSVVSIKDDKLFNYMIIGFLPVDDNGIKYDYSSVVYPQGLSQANNLVLFNKEEITKVLFDGYSNSDMNDIMKKVFEQLNN